MKKEKERKDPRKRIERKRMPKIVETAHRPLRAPVQPTDTMAINHGDPVSEEWDNVPATGGGSLLPW